MKKMILTSSAAVLWAFSANATSIEYYAGTGVSYVDSGIKIPAPLGLNEWSTTNNTTNNALSVIVGADVKIKSAESLLFRVEGEYKTYKQAMFEDLTDGNPLTFNPWITSGNNYIIDNDTLFLNAVFGWKTGMKFNPFVVAGVGVNQYNGQHTWFSGNFGGKTELYTGYSFAWSIGAGLEFDVSEKLAMNLTYKYVDLGKQKYTAHLFNDAWSSPPTYWADTYVKPTNNEVMLSMMYKF